jgi:predicted O-methyltransferase YrrM
MNLINNERYDKFCWFDYLEFYDFISSKNFKILVELGVWKGHSISYLASKNKNSEIYAVDLWERIVDYPGFNLNSEKMLEHIKQIDKIYNEYLELTETRNIINDIQSYTWDAANLFNNNEVDFVFIDAGPCDKNIKAWYPKIRKGGIIAGHDYNFPTVKKIVKKFSKENNHVLNVEKFKIGDVWWIEK